MKYPSKIKLEKIIDKDSKPPILLQPHLRIENDRAFLLAANQRSMVLVPVEVTDEDSRGSVHIESLKACRKIDNEVRLTEEHCIVNGEVAYPRETHTDAYPPFEKLFDSPDGDYEISLNVKALYAIVQALGVDVVKLKLPPDPNNQPMKVFPHPAEPHVEGSSAILMPYRLPKGI